MLHSTVKKNAYYDSVTLMLISSKIAAVKGVAEAAVMMGTAHNKSLMTASGILNPAQCGEITPNDLVIGISAANQEAMDQAVKLMEEQFAGKDQKTSEGGAERCVRTQRAALQILPKANLAIISVPGASAAAEARRAMENGLHVLLFSDNVSIEEEISLKKYAVAHNLLMMGPDCGTAVVNGVALGFANVVRRGKIGIVAASGTGLQELTCLIDRMGGGISQALGTGGRDLKAAVGGEMMLLELDALANDPQTELIGIISKPPAREVMQKIIDRCKRIQKPIVVCFLGGDPKALAGTNLAATETMEDTAAMLVALSEGRRGEPVVFTRPIEEIEQLAETQSAALAPSQKYLRGLYSGGTLAYEAMLMMREYGVYSNIALDKNYLLKNPDESHAHTIVDMGEDFFTNGMPHPMIDMRLRSARIQREAVDDAVAVILLDCVLGFGCHDDPAGEIVRMAELARKAADGRHLCLIASACGTDEDVQPRFEQVETLRRAGIMVMDSNAQAVRLAMMILKKQNEKGRG